MSDPTYARTAQDIAMLRTEAAIARTREEVAQNVDALRRELTKQTDWRQWFRRKPAVFLTAAFALGFLIGRR